MYRVEVPVLGLSHTHRDFLRVRDLEARAHDHNGAVLLLQLARELLRPGAVLQRLQVDLAACDAPAY